MRRVGAILASTVVLACVMPSSAMGADPPPRVEVGMGGDSATVKQERQARAAAAKQARFNQLAASAPAAAYVYVRIPNCPANNINAGIDGPCQEAVNACPPGQLMMQFHRGPVGSVIGQPGWTHVRTACTTDPGSGAAATIPGLTLADFQRLPLPAGSSQVEPPGGNVLVGMPTNVFATPSRPTMLQTVSLGVPIQVRATPSRYSWNFGDGYTLGPTSQPGAAYPALINTHEYQTRGAFQITMTTHYTGEYSIDGDIWLPIPGEAEVESSAVTVTALAGKSNLVADPLP